MNAAERYFAAAQLHDLSTAVAQLADDVVMKNPATEDRVVGPTAVAEALSRLQAACDQFTHTALLYPAPDEDERLYALLFEAKIGRATLQGVDLIEINDSDQICAFTAFARPASSLMALGARMAPPQP